jgi:hypothetical protein
LQTLVGFFSALFVTSFLKGRSRARYSATLSLDIVILLPYLVPTIAWFWFTNDRDLSSIHLLRHISSTSSYTLDCLAEAIDVQLIALSHLAPFAYLVVRLFFDKLKQEDIAFLANHVRSKPKALLLLGGRSMLVLLLAIFALRLMITASKYDLPFFGSKGYEQIRAESWLFTLPLWLDYVHARGFGLAVSGVFSLVGVLSLLALLVTSTAIRRWSKKVAPSFDQSRWPAIILRRLKRCHNATVNIAGGFAFGWMLAGSAFIVYSLFSGFSASALHAILNIPNFRAGLLLSFGVIAVLTATGWLAVPLCRLTHLLSNGWGVRLSFQLIALFLLIPPLLLAISWRPMVFLPRPIFYLFLLFITTFPFFYLQVAATWPKEVASSLAATMLRQSAAHLIVQHLRGGQLRDFAVAAYLVAYVIVTNEVACAALLLPDGYRTINYTFLRLKPMFDSDWQIQTVAPSVVMALGLCVLVPLYFGSRPKTVSPR